MGRMVEPRFVPIQKNGSLGRHQDIGRAEIAMNNRAPGGRHGSQRGTDLRRNGRWKARQHPSGVISRTGTRADARRQGMEPADPGGKGMKRHPVGPHTLDERLERQAPPASRPSLSGISGGAPRPARRAAARTDDSHCRDASP